MKKTFTFILSALLCTLAFGQGKEAVFPKVGAVKPVVDGVLDDVWTNVEAHAIAVPFRAETATEGPEGTTYWKAMWAEEGIYVIVVVNDNVWSPYTGVSGTSDYNYDRIEMYFDTNYVLEDGKGGQVGTDGNRQIAPNPTLDKLDGEMLSGTVQGATYNYAFKVENPAWNLEMFVPWDAILDGEGNPFDKTGTLGFDVQVTDNDDGANARNRVYWSNAGGKDESWNNMDDAGHVTLDGVDAVIEIDKLTVSGGTEITTDNGTVQLTAAVEPANATQTYKWVITNETGMATVNKNGLVTALRNGTVKVKAVSSNDFTSSDEHTITITGQKIALAEVNLFKNCSFNIDDNGTVGVANWGRNPAEAWIVEDSWMTVNCTPKTNIWDVMMYQKVAVDATSKYIVKFKAKASVDMSVPFIIEDTSHDYNKDVTTSSPYRSGSQWNIPVTTQEQWFEFDVIHSSFVEGSTYQPSFQVGMLTGTLSVDSVIMAKESDLPLVDPTAGVKTVVENSIQVYPNPVGNAREITVNLVNAKGSVAVFNSVGQKIMEKPATTNRVKFEVSGLQKGLYFVRTSDGAVQKFIR